MSKIVRFQTVQFSISIEFNSIWPIDRSLSGATSGPEWNWEWWQWRGSPHSTKLQYFWNLTIRLFSVISGTLDGGVLPFCREAVGVFYSPTRLGKLSSKTCIVFHSSTRIHNHQVALIAHSPSSLSLSLSLSHTHTHTCNIMAERFRFMSLGLVRLRTFRLSAWFT